MASLNSHVSLGVAKASMTAAAKMMVMEEALEWNDLDAFAEAAFERAIVLQYDTEIVTDLTTTKSETNVQHWTSHQKLLSWKGQLADWLKSKPRPTKPTFLSNPKKTLGRMATVLATMKENMKGHLSFCEKYEATAFENQLLGLYGFCKWARKQHAALEHFHGLAMKTMQELHRHHQIKQR